MSVPPLGICMYVDGVHIKTGLLRYNNDHVTLVVHGCVLLFAQVSIHGCINYVMMIITVRVGACIMVGSSFHWISR